MNQARLLGLLGFLALFCAVSPGWAQNKKSGPLKPEEKVKFNSDQSEIDSFVASNEKKLSKSRQRQIKKSREILRRNPQYRNKANLLFRIADNEWKEAKYRYFLKRKDYDKRYEAYLNGSLKKRPSEPIADYSIAIDQYKELLSGFPNYKKIDQVVFYLGQGLKIAGKYRQMAVYMSRLINDYPKSRYKTKAHLALGEMYFDRNKMMAAKTNYVSVISDKKAKEYPYALYKLGYALYNLQEYEPSIKAFQEVIEIGLSGKSKITFQSQSYGALALSFAEVNDGWQRARDYFTKIMKGNKELAYTQLEKMARIYNQQDKIEIMFQVYEYLIAERPNHHKIPRYADVMIETYKKQENPADTEKQIMRFFDYFDAKQTWYAANSDASNEEFKNALIQAKQFRDQQLAWLVDYFYKKAIDTEKEKGIADAKNFYNKAAEYTERYIAEFPETKDRYDREFFLAEIYAYQQNDWDQAIKNYTSALKLNPKGEHSKDAAYKVILCAEEKMAKANLIGPPNHFATEKVQTKAQTAKVEYTKGDSDSEFKPIVKKELLPTETSFLEACKNYTDFYPKDGEVPAISFRAAELFIRSGHYSEGIKRLEVIMEHHSKHKFASFAAATLFDANYRLRRWDQMERWGRYMLKKRNYKVLTKKQLKDILALSINKYADELSQKGTKLKKEGKYDEGQALQDKAVDQMLRFLDEFPKHEKSAITLANAAYLTELAERTEKAVSLYERLIKKYKKSPQATEAHFVLGALYESQTKFEKAAQYFEKMAKFPDIQDMEKVKDSIYNAGAIRMALQQYKQAIAIFKSFIKKFPDDPLTADLYFQMARAYEEQKKWRDVRKTYSKYIKKYKKDRKSSLVRVYLLIAETYQKEGKRSARKKASKELVNALKMYGQLDAKDQADKVVKYAAARAHFLQGEYLYQDFMSYKVIPYPQRKLQKTFTKKAELLKKCEDIYMQVLGKYKSFQVSAGAFYRIAEIYNVFAKNLAGLEPPAVLQDQPELLDVYYQFIEEKVQPLERKAVLSARKALDLAHDNKIYNEWSKRSAALLSKMNPDSFPILNDEVVNTEWEVPATFSTQYISDPAGKLEMMIRKVKLKKKDQIDSKAKKKGQDKGSVKGKGKDKDNAKGKEKTKGASSSKTPVKKTKKESKNASTPTKKGAK
jgi:TolA-binding protein